MIKLKRKALFCTIFRTMVRLLAVKEITLRKFVNFSDKQKKLVYIFKYALFKCFIYSYILVKRLMIPSSYTAALKKRAICVTGFILISIFNLSAQEIPLHIQDSITAPVQEVPVAADTVQSDTTLAQTDSVM